MRLYARIILCVRAYMYEARGSRERERNPVKRLKKEKNYYYVQGHNEGVKVDTIGRNAVYDLYFYSRPTAAALSCGALLSKLALSKSIERHTFFFFFFFYCQTYAFALLFTLLILLSTERTRSARAREPPFCHVGTLRFLYVLIFFFHPILFWNLIKSTRGLLEK